MEALLRSKVTTGRPSTVNFNFGVVGEAAAGRRTFIKAITEPYDFIHSECKVHVVPDEELTNASLKNKHNVWLDGYKSPVTDEERNASDNRVHCIFYLFSPHRVLPEDKMRIQRLQGLAPIVPVLAKADAMTPFERQEQLLAVQKMMQEISVDATLPVFFDFEETCTFADASLAASLEDIDLAMSEVQSFSHLQPDETEDINAHLDGDAESESEKSYGFPDNDSNQESIPTTHSHTRLKGRAGTTATMAEPLGSSLQQEQAARRAYRVGHFETAAVHTPSMLPIPIGTSSVTATATAAATAPVTAVPRLRNVFAVVCTSSALGLRVYPWGQVDTHNEDISDLRRLQRLVFEGGSIGRLRTLTQQMSIRQHQRNLAAKRARRALACCSERDFWVILAMLVVLLGILGSALTAMFYFSHVPA